MGFQPFHYANLGELRADCAAQGQALEFSDDLGALAEPARVGNYTVANRLLVHPMEGSDGETDGRPGELTLRRFDRFAQGGAGTIWYEAVAVVPEARAQARQLWLHKGNLDAFKAQVERIITGARKAGARQDPLLIVQLTHSGRFSKPEGKPAPILACHDPYLDGRFKVPADYPVLSDDQLEALEDRFAETALLAKQAGFHGVDLKACHRYLNSELLSAFTREGRYGGSFEGRTRFLLNVADKVRGAVGGNTLLASRLNIYDGIQWPYGWGVDREDVLKPDLTEPLKLIALLKEKGVRLVNVTMGTPYYNPHVNRPYDKGGYVPEEHPLVGVARLTNGIAEVQRANPDIAIVGTGYSWLRQFGPQFAAANVGAGRATLIGFGRQAFAYPDFARDILENGGFRREKCCVACGKCAELLRAGGPAGCVVRDAAAYVPHYRNLTQSK